MNVFKNELVKQNVLSQYDVFLKKWSIDYKEIDIDGKYGITHCIETGITNNPPLFLFHGVGDNSAIMWILNIKELSKHFHCIAVDTLGGPGKSVPNGNYNKQFDQEEWISSILDYFELKNTNIIGVSNGGYMAYNYYLNNPMRVHKIVGIEGAFIMNPIKAMISTIFLLFPEVLIPTNNNMKNIFYKMTSPKSEIFQNNSDIMDYMINIMKAHNQKAMFMHKVNRYKRNEAEKIKGNMLFLLGDYRIKHKKQLLDIMEQDGINYKIIPNAGHGLNMEQSEIVNNEIIKYLLDA